MGFHISVSGAFYGGIFSLYVSLYINVCVSCI